MKTIVAPTSAGKHSQRTQCVSTSSLVSLPQMKGGIKGEFDSSFFPNSLESRINTNKAVKEMKPVIEAYRKKLQKCESPDEIPYPTDIALMYGKTLTRVVFTAYMKGYQYGRKVAPTSAGKSFHVPSGGRVRFSTKQPVRTTCSASPLEKGGRGVSCSADSDYASSLISFDWNLENTAAVSAFSNQCFEVAHVASQEMMDMLRSEFETVLKNGGTFADWRDAIQLKGFEPENPYHLRTNFDTAMNSAYLAGEWQNIQETKDMFPYLRYVAVMDERTRDEHAELNGIVLSVDDPFWDEYYPPNGWNCRCGVEQLTEDEALADPNYSKPPEKVPVAEDWKNNPSDTKKLMPFERSEPITWKEAELNKFTEYGGNVSAAKKIDTDDVPKIDLKKMYEDILTANEGEHPILTNAFISINPRSGVLDKFDNYDVTTLRHRFKYLNYMMDVINEPDEIWSYVKDGKDRLAMLKQIDKSIVLLFEFNGKTYEYFDIITSNNVNNFRKGTLQYYNRVG